MGAVLNDMPVACQIRDQTEPAGESESPIFSTNPHIALDFILKYAIMTTHKRINAVHRKVNFAFVVGRAARRYVRG